MSEHTELQFLLHLLLEYKLPKNVQLVIKDRLRKVEETGPAPARPMQRPAQVSTVPTPAGSRAAAPAATGQQAASTQAILSGERPAPTPIDPMLPISKPRLDVLEDRPVVSRGGSRGPRKF